MLRRLMMLTILFAPAGLSTALAAENAAYELTKADRAFLNKKIVARVHLTARGQFEEILALGVDVLEHHPDPRQGFLTVLVDTDELSDIESIGAKIDVETFDWYQSYAAKSPQTDMGGFRTLSEIELDLDLIHALYPDITTAKFSIGTSYEGRTIWAIKFSDNPDVDEDEPEIFFNALHHAREPAGAAVLMETMARLGEGYVVDSDTMIIRLVDTREIFFVPVVNPDGYAYNELIASSGGGMWRKNRNSSLSPDIGVDLNRNYGFVWGYDDNGSSPNPGSNTYRGTAAFSEPETQAMRAFINAHEFVFTINYHAYSDLYLWPWGYDYNLYTPDNTLFAAIGDSMSSFNGYSPSVSWTLYPTNGEADDWNYGATGEHAKILPFTPEVGSAAEGGFWPTSALIIASQIEDNQAPNLLLIDLADAPERILPAAVPNWLGPSDADTTMFELIWSDSGGVNAAVSYRLRELFGNQRVADDVESGPGLWEQDGFVESTARSSSGSKSYFGGAAAWLQSHLTATNFLSVQTGDTLRARVWYNIENGWDYGYVDVSADGGESWNGLAGNITTMDNPNGNNRGNGITASSGGVFVDATFPLDAFVGQNVLIRLTYQTDGFVLNEGIYFDDISPLIEFDSIVVLDGVYSDTSYTVVGKDVGSYWYDLNGTDEGGQTSGTTPPHLVTVTANFQIDCDCPTHGDPASPGVIDVFDVLAAVSVAFQNGSPVTDPSCPLVNTDISGCNGAVDVFDVLLFVSVAFQNGDPLTLFCDACAP